MDGAGRVHAEPQTREWTPDQDHIARERHVRRSRAKCDLVVRHGERVSSALAEMEDTLRSMDEYHRTGIIFASEAMLWNVFSPCLKHPWLKLRNALRSQTAEKGHSVCEAYRETEKRVSFSGAHCCCSLLPAGRPRRPSSVIAVIVGLRWRVSARGQPLMALSAGRWLLGCPGSVQPLLVLCRPLTAGCWAAGRLAAGC